MQQRKSDIALTHRQTNPPRNGRAFNTFESDNPGRSNACLKSHRHSLFLVTLLPLALGTAGKCGKRSMSDTCRYLSSFWPVAVQWLVSGSQTNEAMISLVAVDHVTFHGKMCKACAARTTMGWTTRTPIHLPVHLQVYLGYVVHCLCWFVHRWINSTVLWPADDSGRQQAG